MLVEQKAERAVASRLREIGPSKSVSRFLQKHGNIRTKAVYVSELALYFRWLKAKGAYLPPDELVMDNLRCVYESKPTDIEAKRKHTDLMAEYVNGYLVERDYSDAKRTNASLAIRGFYKSNDSQLFGDYETAETRVKAPPKPLYPEDIRKVLKTMPARDRTPLIVEWQSGIEINRILGMSFPLGPAPQKVELFGRKGHRRPYWTYIGADSLDHLKLIQGRGSATIRRY